MKKIISFLLPFSLILAGSAAVFAAEPLSVSTEYTYLSDSDDDPYITYASAMIESFSFDEDFTGKYPELAEAVNTWCTSNVQKLTATYEEDRAAAREQRQNGGFEYEASLEDKLMIRRSDDQVFSFLEYFDHYSGGVHGYYYHTGHSFDAQTGLEIPITDVVADFSLLAQVLEERLYAQYEDVFDTFGSEHLLESYGPGEADSQYQWVLDPQGVSFYFPPYAIAAYAAGSFSVSIGFDEVSGLFTDKYTVSDTSYCMQLIGEYYQDAFDINNDGVMDTIKIYAIYDEYDFYSGITVEAGGVAESMEDMMLFEFKPVLMHCADGRNLLYIQCAMENDYACFMVCDLTSGTPQWLGELPYSLASRWDEASRSMVTSFPLSPDSFFLDKRIYFLGTFRGTRPYHIGEDGLPAADQEWYDIPQAKPVVTKDEVPAEPLDSQYGLPTGLKETIPAGEEVLIYRTDSENWADVSTNDGRYFRITLDAPSWPHVIDGREESEYFEVLYYAG